MSKITSVYKELKNLGVTVPSAIWLEIKSKEAYINELVHTDDDTGIDYINKTSVSLLRSIYQRLYEEPNLPVSSTPQVILPTYKYVIDNKGFNSSEEIKGYLSQMLRKYIAVSSLNQQDKAFLGELLSRNFNIKKEVEKYGKVVDLIVAIKEGYSGKSFHIVYSNGRKQHISIKNYIDPGTEVLLNIWS